MLVQKSLGKYDIVNSDSFRARIKFCEKIDKKILKVAELVIDKTENCAVIVETMNIRPVGKEALAALKGFSRLYSFILGNNLTNNFDE